MRFNLLAYVRARHMRVPRLTRGERELFGSKHNLSPSLTTTSMITENEKNREKLLQKSHERRYARRNVRALARMGKMQVVATKCVLR